jgi:hypothetical protein
MIKHGKLVAPTGNRAVVAIQANTPGSDQVGLSDSHPYIVNLLQWETEANEPQELEVLVYPLFRDSALDLTLATLPTFFTTRIDLDWSGGAGAAGNAQRHSTTQRTPAGIGVQPNYVDRELPLLGLPDHGIRYRLACRSLRLRLLVAAAPANFVVVGSIQPTHGGSGEVIPRVQALLGFPQPIPLGATEFRVAAYPRAGGGFDPSVSIRFNECRVPSAFGGDITYVASDCLEWRTLPGESVSVQTLVEAYGTIEFR